MAPNYLGIRYAHYRITLRTWFRGLDKALIAVASALTFLLTAILGMLLYLLAQGLLLLADPEATRGQRITVVVTWQFASFILLRALRDATLMPRPRLFFASLPLPWTQPLRADVILSLLSYSLLWAPVAWALADPIGQRTSPLSLLLESLGEIVAISLALNLALLRGAWRQACIAALALAAFALLPAPGLAGLLARAACAAAATAALLHSYLPGAIPLRGPARRSALADGIALSSGLVVPLLANELRANLAVRAGCIAATLAGCLAVIAIRTNDTSTASVLVFVAAVATLALYALPALCRRTLLTKLAFLAGQPGFARRMRLAGYGIPTLLFGMALGAAALFDRGGRTGLEAAIFSALYVLGVAGARLGLRITAWLMPFATMILLIILGAMT